MRENILGVHFDNITLDEAADRAMALINGGSNHYVVTPNPEIVCIARNDAAFRAVLCGADIVLPDGIGIVYASGILKKGIVRRVPGIDFAKALMGRLDAEGCPLFLLGGRPGVAEKAALELKREFPRLIICGTHDGYFKDDEEILDRINSSGAKVLFVCMGAPRQEYWMRDNLERLHGCRLMAGLGGSLDVFAGEAMRAPDFFVNAGLEWLYRLVKEPKRIGRAMRLPLFLWLAIRERIKGSARAAEREE